jgi:hypothetical protein
MTYTERSFSLAPICVHARASAFYLRLDSFFVMLPTDAGPPVAARPVAAVPWNLFV